MKKDERLTVLSIQTADNQGGAAAIGWQIGLELERRGVHSRFIVSKKVTDSERVYELPLNPFLKRFPKIYGKDWGEIFRFLRTYITANDIDFGADGEIFNHPFYQQADIVQFHNLHGNFFNLSNLIPISQQKKVVWSLHDMWAIMPHGAWSNHERPTEGLFRQDTLFSYPPMLFENDSVLARKKKAIYEQSAMHVVAVSNWLQQKIGQTVLGKFPTSVIHNGVDTAIYKPQTERKTALRKSLRLPEDKKIVLFLANRGVKNYQKGWSYLKSAFDQLPEDLNALLLCIGGDSFVDRSREERSIYIPFISDERMIADYFSTSDVFVLPSIFESSSLTVLQSMACGTPVVAFGVGGVNELVKHQETGYLAKHLDTTDLLRGIRYVFSLSPEKLRKMTGRALDVLRKNFTSEIMADKYLKLYADLFKKQ